MSEIIDFAYFLPGRPAAKCKAAVLRGDDKIVRVAFLEIDANEGPSVTNSWPAIAEQFRSFIPGCPLESIEWYEVYPVQFKDGREDVFQYRLGSRGGWLPVADANLRRRIWLAFGDLVPR